MNSKKDIDALINNTIKTKELNNIAEEMIGKIQQVEPAPTLLKYTKVIPNAFAPTKESSRAAGFDLKSVYDCVVPAKDRAIINTGLKIELPEGCYGRIAPRSGLAVKHFIDVGAGVIDEDYRGEIKVILFNHLNKNYYIKAGDRIAQLICERIFSPELQEVQQLTDTERGAQGFGSTGK